MPQLADYLIAENKDFAALYKVPQDELLAIKKEAIKGFLATYPRPADTKYLGAIHVETGPDEISLQRLLEGGRVKIVILLATSSPVDGQKERYALEKLLEDMRAS